MDARLRETFEAAGCDGFLHACDIDRGGEVGLDADAVVVSASVFKVAVALEFFRQAALGELDATERVRVHPRESIPGPAGLALFSDEIELSLRDLAVSMLTLSDALATDVLIKRVGLERVNELTDSLGLPQTVIVSDVRSMFDGLANDVGFATWEEFVDHPWSEADEETIAGALERMRTSRVLDPTQATRTTPREMTRLLRAIWLDEAAPSHVCAQVRSLMAKQLTRHRIARGFDDPDVLFSGKTGTIAGAYRNEVGVVEFPDRSRFAVAVFTRAHKLYEGRRDIDDAIGVAAALAVETLRAG